MSTNRDERPLGPKARPVGVVLCTALFVLPSLYFVWLVVRSPKTETLTVRSDGTSRYMVDETGHRLAANRYTQALDIGQSARCKVRRFPILVAPVIESCTPKPTRQR